MTETPHATGVGADDLEKVAELREAAEAKEKTVDEIVDGDPGADPAPEPEHHGPTDTDEHPLEVNVTELRNEARVGVSTEALIEQLAYRLLFTEAALTHVVRQLVANGILPRNFEDRVISEAEADVDAIGLGRHREQGRAGLLAAYINHTRSG